jgi:hypothetical protein
MLPQVFRSGGGDRDERAALRCLVACDKASVVGVLPHGQARARRPPRVEHLRVRARFGSDPFEEVENQGIDAV